MYFKMYLINYNNFFFNFQGANDSREDIEFQIWSLK